MLGLFLSPYGLILQAIAIVHFVRRRPDFYWLWIILIFGGLGALVYIMVEVVPDVGLLRTAFQVFPRRKRIKALEAAVIDNPSIGNYEELGDLYLDDGQFAKARECFDRVISPRTQSADPYYRRALSALALGDLQAAAEDLGQVVTSDPKYDYHRAAGLLAHVVGKLGRQDEAAARFADVTEVSTMSETQYNYASLLADMNRPDDARQWAQRILAKKPTMPAYMRRPERPWVRKASALIKRLPRAGNDASPRGDQ
ncbi:MAG: tetratricopeptide repeat protein [Vicinamibacterales bacterium]